MEEFKRFKFAFEYCNKKRKIEKAEEFFWAVQCFKKLYGVKYNHPKVKRFLKQFCTKSLHLGMQYCRRVDQDRFCSCEDCFLFENSKIVLIQRHQLADCFVGSVHSPDILYYRATCPPGFCSGDLKTFENIDEWTSKNNNIVLDYLKIYSVFDSILR